MDDISATSSLRDILEKERKLQIEKNLTLEKALLGNDVNDIYTAESYIRNIQNKNSDPIKSILMDPLELSHSFGYKNKPHNLSYDMLRAMSRTHIIKSIIETRKEQIQNFCQPQLDKHLTGFIVQKKTRNIQDSNEVKLTKLEQAKIEYITEFILACGTSQSYWQSDTFDIFLSKFVGDLLILDQGVFEVQRNRKGEVIGFFCTDGATYRVADTYMDNEKNTRYPEKVRKGYLPSHVQLYQGNVISEFYPWELCFAMMNPQTDIRNNGYGKSPLEDMVQTVTSLLNSDAYNANFFKVGSSPKGILRYSGNINQTSLDDFRQQWIAQVTGTQNAHKVPLINADKLDFINTHVPNKDMEFAKFQEFLIKVSCAQYKMDPSEIGFSMQGESGGGGGWRANEQDAKVKYSKEKGLRPLLRRIEYWLNKYIVSQLDENFELKFVGLDSNTDPQTELEEDIKLVSNLMTLNEMRAKRGAPPIEGGDVPLNPAFLQAKSMQQQKQQGEQDQRGQEDQLDEDQEQGEDDEYNDFSNYYDDPDPSEDDEMTKSLHESIKKLLS